MERNNLYQKWRSGEELSKEQKEYAQHAAILKNNFGTTAVIAGTPLIIGTSAANPYATTQALKTILVPTVAYETLNETARRAGHDSVEQGIINTLGGNDLSSNVKDQISTALSFFRAYLSEAQLYLNSLMTTNICLGEGFYEGITDMMT